MTTHCSAYDSPIDEHMAIYRPPAQGSAYASPRGDNTYEVTYRLQEGDCAICPKGDRLDRTTCVMGPGVVKYIRKPGSCELLIIEGCRMDRYTRHMP